MTIIYTEDPLESCKLVTDYETAVTQVLCWKHRDIDIDTIAIIHDDDSFRKWCLERWDISDDMSPDEYVDVIFDPDNFDPDNSIFSGIDIVVFLYSKENALRVAREYYDKEVAEIIPTLEREQLFEMILDNPDLIFDDLVYDTMEKKS